MTQTQFKSLDSFQKEEDNFTKQGLNTNKTLRNYDCWDEDRTPQQWLELYANDKEYHGKCPLYNNDNQYVWSPFQVMSYDYESEKYVVRLIAKDTIRYVGRLSLMFKDEDEAQFKRRLYQCKKLQKQVEEEFRFNAYIESITPDVCSLPEWQRQNILRRLKKTHSLVRDMIKQVQMEYKLWMKKYFVIKEMENPLNHQRFRDQRIELRTMDMSRRQWKRPLYKYNWMEIRDSLNIGGRSTVDAIAHVTRKGEQRALFRVFGLNELPMTIGAFEQSFPREHEVLWQQMVNQWRLYLIQDVQDTLRNTYQFYTTDETTYEGSEVHRVLKKIDYIYHTYTYDRLLIYNLQYWEQTIRQFIIPSQSEEPWNIPSTSLLQLFLRVNQRKKKQKSIEEDEESLISIEPSLLQLTEALTRPFSMLTQGVSTLYRLEKELMPLLPIPLQCVIEIEEETVHAYQANVRAYLKLGFQGPISVMQQFMKFTPLFMKSTTQVLKRLLGDQKAPPILSLDLHRVKLKVMELIQQRTSIERLAADEVRMGMFTLITSGAKEVLAQRANEMLNAILARTSEIVVENIAGITRSYQEMLKQILLQPKNEQELVNLKNYLQEIDINLSRIKEQVDCTEQYLEIFDLAMYNFSHVNIENFWYLKSWPSEILQSQKQGLHTASQSESIFTERLEKEKVEFVKECTELAERLEVILMFDNYKMVKENSAVVISLRDRIERAQECVRSFNHREGLFRLNSSEWDEFQRICETFEPYHKLWELCMEFELDRSDWQRGPFLRLDNLSIERKVSGLYIKESLRVHKYFQDNNDSRALRVSNDLGSDIEAFRQQQWVIALLTTEAITRKPIVWREVFRECHMECVVEELNLLQLWEADILHHRTAIEDISMRATKQWALEKKLNELVDRLKVLKVEFLPQYETWVLKSIDEVQQVMDDEMNALIILKSSAFIKPILNRANLTEQKILLIQDTLEGWIKFQRGWLYLHPIFNSPDVQKAQKQKFDVIDRTWRNTMEYFTKEPNLWENIDGDRYRLEFEQGNRALGEIYKSLNEYLENKRRSFPRLFFLSDEELLEVLAHTLRHINKCFEGVHELGFRDNVIVSLLSAEKEEVHLIKPVDVSGNVDAWLGQVEIQMRKSIQLVSLQPAGHNILDTLGQCVLSTSQLKWTHMVEASIQSQQDQSALQSDDENTFPTLMHLANHLQQLVAFNVSLLARAAALDRLKLQSLIILQVHNRDTVQALSSIQDIVSESFAWKAHLRYYLVKKRIRVRILNADIRYGFEYLGNSPRLVITPLTDRCYRTLIEAFLMTYGGAPEGPPGTGKSETVKDLAKALAIQCVVFNCSDGLSYLSMSKFFKGLASSGAWCCFDEFNRIDQEVLSVVAQQILTIHTAIREKKKSFYFSGSEYTLISTCLINITMNPDYKIRLPDNLKCLFRQCAMLIPDHSMISTIYLLSVGYANAQQLSVKVVLCLRLSGEQLSCQDHYDFGMRALKSVLSTCGHLKVLQNDVAEERLCLKAIIDVNMPKLVEQDIPLFNSILTDLFPLIEVAYTPEMIKLLPCQRNDQFIEKCQQLYSTLKVRHGVICVGRAYSGKSSVISHLHRSLIRVPSLHRVNPKAILPSQLFGRLDPETHIWTEGVVPIIMREVGSKWVLFDGPVDTLWVENMNTLLDDNRKLCLTSGEIIRIDRMINIIFEVEDLTMASPATISRCGIVYFQSIGWWNYIQDYTWHTILLKHIPLLHRRLKWLVGTSLAWLSNQLQSLPLPLSEVILVKNVLLLIKQMTSIYTSNLPTDFEEVLSNICLFATVWGIGGSLHENLRMSYNQLLQSLITADSDIPTQYKLTLQHPFEPQSIHVRGSRASFFSLLYAEGRWSDWSQTVTLPQELAYHDLIVPTSDSQRNNYFINLMVLAQTPVLLCGVTGTGKTKSTLDLLQRKFNDVEYCNMHLTYSCSTEVNAVQRAIEGRVSARRRKGYYGPEDGKKGCVVFVDDLGMPTKEVYGAQPPIELLRQLCDSGGWYDLVSKEFKYMQDISLIGAMSPHKKVSLRFLRHFLIMYVPPMDAEQLTCIFSTVIEWICVRESLQLTLLQTMSIVKASIQMCSQMQCFMATPNRSHYSFNIRDIARVFGGLRSGDTTALWIHETQRVYSDRLISMDDECTFNTLLQSVVLQHFKRIWSHEDVVYAHLDGKYTSTDIESLGETYRQSLMEFNSLHPHHHMALVLFGSAIHHISRITRVLHIERGNLLLVGMGGSGRRSLLQMGCFVALRSLTVTVDHHHWVPELQRVLKQCTTPTVLALRDSQLLSDEMVEQVTILLNTGEVPPPEKKITEVENNNNPNPRKHLHVVLCMSPTSFRQRLRQFPSLTNSCYIDWFLEWPQESLRSIALQFLPTQVVDLAVEMQEGMVVMCRRYYEELGGHFYVTPTTYLQLLRTFKRLMESRTQEMQHSIQRLRMGVERILHTEEEVSMMKNDLVEMQPQLERATLDNSLMLINLQKKQKEADGKKLLCEYDEKECNTKREIANSLRDDCQQELDQVLPLLQGACEALDKISKDDMVQLKSFGAPPPSAAIVMEGLCYIFNEDQNVKVVDKEKDFWGYAKKHILNDKLIKRIRDFKEEQIRAIPSVKVSRLKNFITNMEKEKVFNASKAAGNLAQWIRAVISTYEALLVVDPKRQELKISEVILQAAEEQLSLKKEALKEVLDLLGVLENEYQIAKQGREQLESQVNRCKTHLARAEKLIQGLSGQKQSWRQRHQDLEGRSIMEDMLLASGVISYLGAFPVSYRRSALTSWMERLGMGAFSLQEVLSDPVQVGTLTNQYRLPNDGLSIENAIILQNSLRWPLMVDPQMQANTWLKNMESNMVVMKASQPLLQVDIDMCIQNGRVILLEGVGETIDGLFDVVLNSRLSVISPPLKSAERVIEYHADFRLYITTMLSLPHYSAEVCVQVTMLNFMVTQEGLEDQMLNIIVRMQEPTREEQRQRNIRDFHDNKNKQKHTEDLILSLLNQSQGNLLENETLILNLQRSKIESIEIEEKLRKQEHDREQFTLSRNAYTGIARPVSHLFFSLLDLCSLQPTYQWSLDSYIQLFQSSISTNRDILNHFKQALFTRVCQGLLEKDKIIFSLIMQIRLLLMDGATTVQEVRILMTPTPVDGGEPPSKWVSQQAWDNLTGLQQTLECFRSVQYNFTDISFIHLWENYMLNPPSLIQPYWLDLTQFQRLILLRALRPHSFMDGIRELITSNLGFIEPPPFNLDVVFKQSDASTPLIFILCDGVDPAQAIHQLSERVGMKNQIMQLSLGQGQSHLAKQTILTGIEEGKWVILQNCNVSASFMVQLERLYEQVICNVQKENSFRLWLTTTDVFPISLLHRGIKITLQPPRGLRNNLLRIYQSQDAKTFDESPFEYKKLLFGLSYFHSVVIGRCQYGQLGWSVPYEFSGVDLAVSQHQLRQFGDQYEALTYLIGEINYGGRVADTRDRKILNVLINQYCSSNILLESHRFTNDDVYYAPNDGPLQSYIDYIQQLPIYEPSTLFGLHSNADTTMVTNETNFIASTILSLLPRTPSTGSTMEQDVYSRCKQVLGLLRPPFNMQFVVSHYPIKYEDCINTVLQQELIRYNRLLQMIRDSIESVVMAIDGSVVMTKEIEQIIQAIFDNYVPQMWRKLSYPSERPFQSYIQDFVVRQKYMDKWVLEGPPSRFWIVAMFFPQSFLTGIQQNFARLHQCPIETLNMKFTLVSETVAEGIYMEGLHFEGARWDELSMTLRDPEPNVLLYDVPLIRVQPTREERDIKMEEFMYDCPIYKTHKRQTCVMSIKIPTQQSPEVWLKRGLAMLMDIN